MFLIGAVIFISLVVLISIPLIRRISQPLEANHPLAARSLRVSLWIGVLSLATWPVGMGSLLFKLNCTYFTKFQITPTVDARNDGYLDERLSMSEYVQNHMDGLFLNKNVEDLVAGRIAFFEMKKPGGNPGDNHSLPYLRYSLLEIGSQNCSPKVFGFADGQGLLVTGAPGKCVGIESVPNSKSKYQIHVSGDVNQSDGTTKILETSTGKVVAIFRSFYFSFFGSGSYCPIVNVEGEADSAHIELTKLVFVDKHGLVRKATLR